jgi:hypothetical protein
MPANGKLSRTRRIAVWLCYLALFALSIPWYLPSGSLPPLWLGLPYWVVISLACCVLIAGLNVIYIYKSWPDDEDEP